jgi:carbonic anhydrase/acetyltransferase-like protein (isoleucine patch superfamily)
MPPTPLIIPIDGRSPVVDEQAWVAPTAVLAGAVTLAAEVSVWYGTVVRADTETITIGPRTNLQDGVVVHADPGVPVTVGAGVSVGHRAVLHGCTQLGVP